MFSKKSILKESTLKKPILKRSILKTLILSLKALGSIPADGKCRKRKFMQPVWASGRGGLLTICLLIGKPMYKLVNPEFTVSLHQL